MSTLYYIWKQPKNGNIIFQAEKRNKGIFYMQNIEFLNKDSLI